MDTMRLHRCAALATLGLVACQDPSFDVVINDDALEALGATDYELSISVISAADAGAAAFASGREATCEDIAFGRIPLDIIDGARRASVSYGGKLSGVPRVENKLVVVEARKAGKRYGAGCTAWGPVEEDASVKVTLAVAPLVQVFERADTTEPSSVRVQLLAPWDEQIEIPGQPVLTEMHAGDDASNKALCGPAYEGCLADGLGQFVTPLIAPPEGGWPDGPATTVVRVMWGDRVVRIPSFRDWRRIETEGARITLAEPASPGFSALWAFPAAAPIASQEIFRFAATVQQPAADAEQLLVVEYLRSSGTISSFTLDAPGARAVAFFDGRLITALPTGFYSVTQGRALNLIGPGLGSGPVHQLHAVAPCPGHDNRLLALRNGTYTVYKPDGTVASAPDDVAVLAAELDRLDETLITSACLSLDDGTIRVDQPAPVRQVVVSRGIGLGLRARVVGEPVDRVALLPDVSSAASFEVRPINGEVRSLAVGVESTLSGPHATSYKLTELSIGTGMPILGFIPAGGIDTPLAAVPESIDVLDVDADSHPDLVAALMTGAGMRLQVNLGRLVNREPVAAVTSVLESERRATHPQVRFLHVDRDDRAELIIATDEGIDVFCLDREPGGASCVSP